MWEQQTWIHDDIPELQFAEEMTNFCTQLQKTVYQVSKFIHSCDQHRTVIISG